MSGQPQDQARRRNGRPVPLVLQGPASPRTGPYPQTPDYVRSPYTPSDPRATRGTGPGSVSGTPHSVNPSFGAGPRPFHPNPHAHAQVYHHSHGPSPGHSHGYVHSYGHGHGHGYAPAHGHAHGPPLATPPTPGRRLTSQFRSAAATGPQTPSAGSGLGAVAGTPMKDTLWKTELCVNFERGSCKYGPQCRFAHGAAELRPRVRELGYKSQPCPDPVRVRSTLVLPPSPHPPAAAGLHGYSQPFSPSPAGAASGTAAAGGLGGLAVSVTKAGFCSYASRCDYCHPGEALRRVLPGSRLAAQNVYQDAEYTRYIKEEFPDTPAPWGFYV